MLFVLLQSWLNFRVFGIDVKMLRFIVKLAQIKQGKK